jgi:hypothetical protein
LVVHAFPVTKISDAILTDPSVITKYYNINVIISYDTSEVFILNLALIPVLT